MLNLSDIYIIISLERRREMKKEIITIAILSGLILVCLMYLQQDDGIKAKIEVLKVHDCGHVDFKLTNMGANASYSGYDKTCPVSLIDRKISAKWLIDPGPWCGTGLRGINIEKGESVNFMAANYGGKGKWRLGIVLYPPEKPRWFEKVLTFMNIQDSRTTERICSREIDEFPGMNVDFNCPHQIETVEIEEPPETSSIE